MITGEDRLVVALDADLPTKLAVGAGNCLFVSGSCSHPSRSVRRLALAVDGERHDVVAHGMPSHDAGSAPAVEGPGSDSRDRAGAAWGGFWGIVPVPAVGAPRTAVVDLIADLNGGQAAALRLGEVELLPRLESTGVEASPPRGDDPLVAICMATFEPPAELLEAQLASLRAQTHGRWVCLISDDGSSGASSEHLRSLTADDPRFTVTRSPRRMGLYRNFERALSMVPPEAEYVALCDQDDRWYPDKISVLLETIGDAELAYSDMRVLDESGRVVFETFWDYKRNNYRNLSSLLLDNTVTGAASLFRRRLLEIALPFPPRFADSYHDHWLASVALTTGTISYVDRPLHDYVQHPAAAIGHPSVGAPPATGRRDRLEAGREAYFKHLVRVATAARVLELRCASRIGAKRRRAVHRVARLAEPPEPVLWLIGRALRPLVGRNETLSFERTLLKAVAWRRASSRRALRTRRSGPADERQAR